MYGTLAAFLKHISLSTAITDSILFPTSDLKKQLNLPTTATDDDTFLNNAASVARKYIESNIGGGFAVRLQTKELNLNRFPSSGLGEVEIPVPQFNSIESVKYYDGTNTLQTLASTDYRLIERGNGYTAKLYPLIDDVWPATKYRQDAVQIRFNCGSTCSSDVSPTISHAVKLLVAHWYENRGAVIVGTISKEMEFGINSLLATNEYGFYG